MRVLSEGRSLWTHGFPDELSSGSPLLTILDHSHLKKLVMLNQAIVLVSQRTPLPARKTKSKLAQEKWQNPTRQEQP